MIYEWMFAVVIALIRVVSVVLYLFGTGNIIVFVFEGTHDDVYINVPLKLVCTNTLNMIGSVT